MRAPIFRSSKVSRDLLLLTLLAGILFGLQLGARDLWAPNEPIYGRAVAEMHQRGDWLVPSINQQIFAEKPILYYWAALTAAGVTGSVDEQSLRLPSLVAGVASIGMTYLLVLPYVGRRRAWIAVALFATMYQVFWAARAVQMDILVLASTLGTLLALTRMLDFGASARKSWAWAGLALGLGFAAKGPVALLLPGLVSFAYAASTRRLRVLCQPAMAYGAIVCVLAGSPWYLGLWLRGETTVLYEVLIRQNFERFVDAWDHRQPWWYFLKYLWIDYAPWSWLLPAAAFTASQSHHEGRLQRLCWLWIGAIILFFSLSESKRAPYILPIAPAIAALAAGVVERWLFSLPLRRAAHRLAATALNLFAVVLATAGIALGVSGSKVPAGLGTMAAALSLGLALLGVSLLFALAIDRFRPNAPALLLVGICGVYLTAAVWILPAVDSLKSARGFAAELNHQVDRQGGSVVSFGLWDWRASYAYYAKRTIPNLHDADELRAFWTSGDQHFVLVEESSEDQFRQLLPDAVAVHKQNIGSRTATLFSNAAPDQTLSTLASLSAGSDAAWSTPVLRAAQ